ncbi:MAG: chemotaxis protein CheC [Firmicutes bacterium]|nr:chemotaxis protein CheC [Bacillota bacterium]
MSKIGDLNNFQLDVLKEIGNIGAGHAATALSQLISEPIAMTVPNVSVVSLSEVSEILGGAEQEVVGVYMRMFGDVPGKIIFVFAEEEALTLAGMLTGNNNESQTLNDYEKSALQEIGNIMTGAYLYALTKLTGYNVLSSVPILANDMVGAILNTALLEFGIIGDYALFIQTQFSLTQRKINGHFFLVPDPGALDVLLDALGVEVEWKK